MWIEVDHRAPQPPSEQIADQLRFAVAAGRLVGGDRLPSVRALAARVRVNPNTVSRAWRDLEREGVIEGRSGAGVFVAPAGPDLCRAWARRALADRIGRAVSEAIAAGLGEGEIEALVRCALRGTSERRTAG